MMTTATHASPNLASPNLASPTAGSPQCTDVIFDFCGVLIDWQCAACLRGHVPDSLITDICADSDPYGFFRYESYMDQGRDFADVLAEYREEFGETMAQVFAYYIQHYGDSLTRLIPGMRELLEDLQKAGAGVWGLTNWSHETFHVALERFAVLGDLIDGIVVSGAEKMYKPNADIYELTIRRFGLQANRCIFYDDTMANVIGARAVGMRASHFADAATTRRELTALGVLPERANS